MSASTPTSRPGGRASIGLDALRAGAALLVLVGHIRGLFFVTYADVERRSTLVRLFYLVTGLGHQAVMAFFVLSGFLIARGVRTALVSGSWSWRGYLLRRLVRLYVVLVPALLLCAFWDRLGMLVSPDDAVYLGRAGNRFVLNFSVAERAGARELLGNLVFLQEIVTRPFGSDGVLWSLSYEFWYYVLFPCLALAWSARSVGARLVHLLAAFGLSMFVGGTLVAYFAIWMLGAGAALLPPPRGWSARMRRLAHLWAGSIAVGALLAVRALPAGFAADIGIGLVFAAVVYVLAHSPAATDDGDGTPGRAGRLARGTAGFTYTLYLVHMPVLVFASSLLHDAGMPRAQPAPVPILLGLLLAAVVIAYAWGVSRLTEAKTPLLWRRLAGAVSAPRLPAVISGARVRLWPS